MVKQGDAQYGTVVDVLRRNALHELPDALSATKTLSKWMSGKFTAEGNEIRWNGNALPGNMGTRLLNTLREGKTIDGFMRFWELLQQNPSKRSVDQLWTFLQHENIAIGKDGFIYAYKGVRNDYMDIHSGTFKNSPGAVMECDRNKVSDDPRVACSDGFHVGNLSYARSFGPKLMIVRLSPKDVVCIPYDSSQQKMRTCRYEVVGHHGVDLPDALIEDEDLPENDAEDIANASLKHQPSKPTPERLKQLDDVDQRLARKHLSENELQNMSIGDMRKFAANTLKIVGASKIPGGKLALIKKIIKIQSRADERHDD